MTIAEERPIEALPEEDLAFHVEQHGIDFIPENERWAKPRDLAGMWAGASVQVEYFIYGAILMTFGLSFGQTLSIIIIGNLSYFLLGLCSLQGPQTGTTVFGINRASFGPNGSRIIAGFNWLTQIGFEVEGLLLIVGAALVLFIKGGFNPGHPAEVVFVIVAVAIQIVLPLLGHATIVKTLRLLVIPFIILFGVLLIFTVQHAQIHSFTKGADWQTYMAGLAFTITLSGLGWAECGNDYSRYLDRKASKKAIVGWVFLGTAIPEILIMTLGAAVATIAGLTKFGESSNAFLPFAHQSAIPAWFVVTFLLFAIVQLFAINSLDMYSSGVTLQAMGAKVKRYQAVIIDSALCLVITLYAIFNASFSQYLKDFVNLVIIWIAPWVAIYLVDWWMRRSRYVPAELQRTDKEGLYYRKGGVFWPAIVAQAVGMFAAITGLAATPPIVLPHWLNSVYVATKDSYGYGADFSIFMGMAVAGLLYLGLGWRGVRRQADRQDEMLSAAGLLD